MKKLILVFLILIISVTSLYAVDIELLGIPNNTASLIQRYYIMNKQPTILLPHINEPLSYPHRGGVSIVILRVNW